MLFAYSLAFEALLGCFHVEKKSVASAKRFLIHSLCLLFQSRFPTCCGNAQRQAASLRRNWSLPLEQALPLAPHQAMLPALPTALPGSSSPSPVFQTGHLKLMGPCAQGCGLGHRLHLRPLPLQERKGNCFIIRSDWG